jgi:hypothetical protein
MWMCGCKGVAFVSRFDVASAALDFFLLFFFFFFFNGFKILINHPSLS